MFTINPFSELSELIPAYVQQGYVIAMAILVIGGTVIDTLHKKSAKWFFKNAEDAQKNATRKIESSEKLVIAAQTGMSEVLTSSEFSSKRRRLSHLFSMYGFVLFVATTAIMIFLFPGAKASTPAIWPMLWHLGALMLAFGGYWFWFFIRVDVAAEGRTWYHLVKADMFILSLLAMVTFGLIWSYTQHYNRAGWDLLFLGLFILASTILFGGVLWSKFAHMFFKPAAAYQKRITKADGSAENLPTITRDDPKQQERHSMELLKDAPMDMGLGIKRERPNHY